MRRLRQLALLAAVVGSSGSAVPLAISTPTASAHFEVYQNGVLVPNGTWHSGWGHIELNMGFDNRASHETCIDEYLDPNGSPWYTTASCEYYYWEVASQKPGKVWGYSRVWNGGSVEHWVTGEWEWE